MIYIYVCMYICYIIYIYVCVIWLINHSLNGIHIQTAMKIPNASDKGETGLKSPPKKKRLDAGEFMTPQATSILHGKPRNSLGVAPWQHPKHVAMGRPCSSY